MAQQIYCDESGFSGNNLLTDDGRFFVYSSVALTESEAAELVRDTIAKHRVQGGELKAKNLLGNPKHVDAIDEIVTAALGRTKLVIFDKRYALACKVFEYTVEPVLADQSTFFYSLDFHKFVANTIFLEMLTGEEKAHRILHEFQEFMRLNLPADKFALLAQGPAIHADSQIGRASWRERV